MTKSIAVLGLGGMGSGMALALLSAGFGVTVYNRTTSKADPLVAAGARLARSPAAAVSTADAVLLSLADEAAVESLLFVELAGKLRPQTMVIDTSTVSPGFARDATERLSRASVRRVEACVVGNPQMAASGALRVFAAGRPSDVDDIRDVLDTIGQDVRQVGPAGMASVLKLAFNLLLGVQTAGLGEAVVFAESLGIDRETLLDALDNSGWRSPVLSFRSDFMRRRDYRPAGFRAELMHKDLTLAYAEALAHGVGLPLTERAAERFSVLLSEGRGDDDAASVVDVRTGLAIN